MVHHPISEITLASARTRGVAIFLSHLASPPVSAVAVMFLAVELAGNGNRWLALHVGLAVALPLTYLLLLRNRGDVSDLEVVERTQRHRPYAFAALANVLATSVLAAGGAPRWILAIAAGVAANVVVVWLITHRWKISFHCSSLAYLGSVFWLTRSESTLLWGGMLAMIWARVSLRRHTLAQALAGTALGIGLGFVTTTLR